MTSLITNIYDNISTLLGVVAFGTVTYYGIKYITSSNTNVDEVAQKKINNLVKRMSNDQVEIANSKFQISELQKNVTQQQSTIDHLNEQNTSYKNQIMDLKGMINNAKNDPSILNDINLDDNITNVEIKLPSLSVVEVIPPDLLPNMVIGELLRDMSTYQIAWLLAALMALATTNYQIDNVFKKQILKPLVESFNRIRKDKDRNILTKYFSDRLK